MEIGSIVRLLTYNGKVSIRTYGYGAAVVVERHIRVSTQGRITIPKAIRDRLKIRDGQPLVVRTDEKQREILLVIQPTISEY